MLVGLVMLFIVVIVVWFLVEIICLFFMDVGLGGEEYVGLVNYQDLFDSWKFYQMVVWIFYWMFLLVGLKLVLGLIGVVLLNVVILGCILFCVLVMLFWVILIVIGCIGWFWFYNGYFGVLLGMMMLLGIMDGLFEFFVYK